MTEAEFRELQFREQLSHARDEDFEDAYEIADLEQVTDNIDDILVERSRRDTWQEVRDWLNDIPTEDGFYRDDGWGDYVLMDDDDISDFIDELVEHLHYRDFFDEDTEEDDDDEYFEEPELSPEEIYDLQPLEDEVVTITQLFAVA